ncbi:GrpB domain, predicted nucleotidyltransferase, UPF0157 family [Oceanobacillus limi]|uniref:GrpB domain, predicted nucleotidyltransferase, UPF0157 family n=1 Tax=Oceanobacillus limi TaxID=930131 RepID=A0A1H9YEE2_9BACI|nr:GrpB family protein [Oceanobacillus limi]SES67256.1 GrpB domain, predicted nucleotidyltransferase, UPF0157 family [Oceanobacillus limi]
MRKVEVVPYQPAWKNEYLKEAEKLNGIFTSQVISIHHIGSTSIPNLSAKPIIDILIVVKDLSVVDDYNIEMENLGYRCRGENGIVNRRYFSKGGDDRTHHVHVFEQGNPEINRHLAFRDYMIHLPKEAVRYGQLKEELARKIPNDIDQYIAGKHDYIQVIDKKAEAWKDAEGEKLTCKKQMEKR